jgi:hypothetical protein
VSAGYSQAQNDADKAEFESAWLPLANNPIDIVKPFSEPTHRMKLDATTEFTTIPPGEAVNIDLVLTAERWTFGGEALIVNAQPGDWYEAMVMDIDGVIPVPYRVALCEAYPIVNQYIARRWVLVEGVYSNLKIDTRPLIAKMTAGLYLRVVYHATEIGTARQVFANYNLAKKL